MVNIEWYSSIIKLISAIQIHSGFDSGKCKPPNTIFVISHKVKRLAFFLMGPKELLRIFTSEFARNYVVTCPVFNICEIEVRMPGSEADMFNKLLTPTSLCKLRI